jgi:predicted outer membrane lipoprotein
VIEIIIAKLGMSAALGTLKDIPWKWIIGALVAGAIGLTVFLAYAHVENLKKDLVVKTEQLAKETAARQLAEATTNAIKLEHDFQVARISDLESQRYDIAIEVTKLRTDLANLDLEQDLESDNEQKADAAIGRLNAAHARVDQLLREASGARPVIRAGKAPGGKAGASGARGYFDRAVQALRKDGVPNAH